MREMAATKEKSRLGAHEGQQLHDNGNGHQAFGTMMEVMRTPEPIPPFATLYTSSVAMMVKLGRLGIDHPR